MKKAEGAAVVLLRPNKEIQKADSNVCVRAEGRLTVVVHREGDG